MARDENPPFLRGETIYNGGDIDLDDLAGENLEGKEYVFEDKDRTSNYSQGSDRDTGFPVTVRVVRNMSGQNLKPKRLASLKTTGYFGRRAAGYSRLDADDLAFPIDEFLPAAGVPNGDLFYVVVRGPAIVKSDLAGGANNLIPEGTKLVALTASTTSSTTGSTGGRVKPADFTGATSALAGNVRNVIGTALSAATTGNTDSDMLVAVGW